MHGNYQTRMTCMKRRCILPIISLPFCCVIINQSHISIYIWGEWPHPPIATCADILTETAGVPHPHEEAYSKTNNTLCLEIQDQTQQTQHPWAYMTLIVKEHHQCLFGGGSTLKHQTISSWKSRCHLRRWFQRNSNISHQLASIVITIQKHTLSLHYMVVQLITCTYIIELGMIYVSGYQTIMDWNMCISIYISMFFLAPVLVCTIEPRQTPLTFHYAGCLTIRILTMIYHILL